MAEDGIETLKKFDAIFLGAVGAPGVPDHISLWDLLLVIRKKFDQYINLRPVKLLKGAPCPLEDVTEKDVDMIFVRENSEGEYCGLGEIKNPDSADETVIQNSVFTRKGTERIIRYAYEYAKNHQLNKVLSATKSNALNYSMVFWDKVFHEVAAEYKDIDSTQMHIDALAGYFIMHPDRMQVVVASNLFGDILTDLGSAMLGSIGISPSANLNPEGKYPSMFEPIHGSAPDIAGKGIANPVGTFWAAAMMLDHLKQPKLANKLMDAVTKVLSEQKVRTPGSTTICLLNAVEIIKQK
jgi:tartrate dehydrogenase/decarboxylase/D-malate dehydrogenase